MGTLRGILAELGIAIPSMHPEPEIPHATGWVLNEPFAPVIGQTYDLTFGKILFDGEDKHVVKRVRIKGRAPSDWIDVGEGRPLHSDLHNCPVRGFRWVKE